MPTIRNVSPLGDVDVPLLNQIVLAGAEVKVTEEQAEQLLLQESNWKPVKGSRRTAVDPATVSADDSTEGES